MKKVVRIFVRFRSPGAFKLQHYLVPHENFTWRELEILEIPKNSLKESSVHSVSIRVNGYQFLATEKTQVHLGQISHCKLVNFQRSQRVPKKFSLDEVSGVDENIFSRISNWLHREDINIFGPSGTRNN